MMAMTCGQGLAEHSALPAKLGELMAAVGDVLDVHLTALDLADESSRQEDRVYRELVERHRQAASLLDATARLMARQRDLPMGRHDLGAMPMARVRETFERFVTLEQELAAMLRHRLEADRRMLGDMASTAQR